MEKVLILVPRKSVGSGVRNPHGPQVPSALTRQRLKKGFSFMK